MSVFTPEQEARLREMMREEAAAAINGSSRDVVAEIIAFRSHRRDAASQRR